jgi:hypothetical protein
VPSNLSRIEVAAAGGSPALKPPVKPKANVGKPAPKEVVPTGVTCERPGCEQEVPPLALQASPIFCSAGCAKIFYGVANEQGEELSALACRGCGKRLTEKQVARGRSLETGFYCTSCGKS